MADTYQGRAVLREIRETAPEFAPDPERWAAAQACAAANPDDVWAENACAKDDEFINAIVHMMHIIAGKPSVTTFEVALERLQETLSECLSAHMDLHTDVLKENIDCYLDEYLDQHLHGRDIYDF